MTGCRFSGGRKLSVFFAAEAAFQHQKVVIVLKQDIQSFYTGSEEKICTKKMTCILHVEMAISRCENQGVIKL